MKTVISKNDIISAFAYCGIRQSPYNFPLNLETALTALANGIDDRNIFESKEKKSIGTYLEIEEKEIDPIIKDLTFNIPEIAIWNVTKVEQDNGITDPEDPRRTVKFGVIGRGIATPEDRDFIDLDALRRNVAGMLYRGEE